MPHVGNSGYSDNTLSLYAKKFLSKSTLSFNFDYSRDAVHYYGYNPGIEPIPSKDSILQRFSYISPSIRLQSHLKDTTKLNYDMRVKYYNLSDLFQTSENNVNADITLKKYYQGYNIAVASDFDYLNTRQVHDTNNDLTIRLAPGFNFTRNKLTAIIGSPFAFDINSKTNVYWYPTAEFNYTLVDYIFIGYGGIEGALDRNSFKTFTDLNPFTSSFVNLTNSNRHDIYLGGRGSIDRQTTFNVQATYAEIQNMPLFISQSLAGITNKFNVIYDNAEHFNMHGEITYRKSSKWLFVFSGDYNYYKMATQQHAWYTPQIQLNASMIYNLKDKISLKSDVYYIGKQLARIDENSLPAVVKSLNGLIDVNLSIEYKYTRLLSFFVSGDNLAGIRYQRWYNYPSQSAYGMLGVLLKF